MIRVSGLISPLRPWVWSWLPKKSPLVAAATELAGFQATQWVPAARELFIDQAHTAKVDITGLPGLYRIYICQIKIFIKIFIV